MKASTPQLKAKHNQIFKYNMRVRKPMTYDTTGTMGIIKIQTPESEKTIPDQGMQEPQPQTSAKATLRLDEAGSHELWRVVVHNCAYTLHF
ncbi:hypothetical protein [Nitrosopumilus ureiphilus]|uniref:Uncharacterized protein n=3 Tax=Nitrosopumilus ureiphilus TaxID=1470067 RepID=A0A7D5RAY9_9ARCH|nr:hypothetical protein [Nitrosopumilus ureiphilus]QLH06884.1 hypothetical protein C5F50_07205 [Nitrosopumilus ureiphilus]